MTRRAVRAPSPLLLLGLIVVGVPLALLTYESRRTGLSYREILGRISRKAARDDRPAPPGNLAKGETIPFLAPRPVGETPDEKSTISHVTVSDLDQDGLNDILLCDVLHQRVKWIRQSPRDEYAERLIGEEIAGPAHVETCDLDRDGDLDVMVSAMGMILPNNDKLGKVILLENDGNEDFTTHVSADKICRVTDVRCGDLDGDGDVDLAVGQFGYDQGEIRWMRNLGGWRYSSEILLSLSGTIHTPVADMDGDGDLDIVALVSQEWEEVYGFDNDGRGGFRTRILYGVADDDYGSSGIAIADLDSDGDPDIVWSNGDAFVATDYRPMPSHGLQWLENTGNWAFAYHRLGDFPGAYDPDAADMDGDGDLDVVAVSGFNYWDHLEAQSMMWWENQGDGSFVGRDLAAAPTHLITMALADMNGDGLPDAVTGSMNLYPPFDRIGRITLWINRWGAEGER